MLQLVTACVEWLLNVSIRGSAGPAPQKIRVGESGRLDAEIIVLHIKLIQGTNIVHGGKLRFDPGGNSDMLCLN